MRLVRIDIDMVTFTFVCESADTKNGFKHVCNMFEFDRYSNYPVETATCYYYNRTWEKYSFQSAMLAAVQKRIENVIADEKKCFMLANNLKRLAGANKERFEKLVSENGYIDKLQKLKKDLQDNCY